MLTSVAQLALSVLLAGSPGQNTAASPQLETPLWWLPRQRWAEAISLEEFYGRWGKGWALFQFPLASPEGPFVLGPGWAERLREKIPEWTRRPSGTGTNDDPQADPASPFPGKVNTQLDGPWGSLKAKLEVDAAQSAEVRDAERWQAEQALQVPVAGPLYVFGQVNAGYNTWTAQQRTLGGRTGIGCKVRPIAGSEIVLSGSSQANYSEDPLQPKLLPVAKSQLVLELQANYSLLGALKLEYQGSAMPALDPLDHSRVQHDFRFAVPLGRAGDLRLGAKHQWEDQPGVTRPWIDGMQLYLGLGLKR
jgi:hypothetical protein